MRQVWRFTAVALAVTAAATATSVRTDGATASKDRPSGFVSRPDQGESPKVVEVPAGHDARLWKALDRLAAALEEEDRAGFAAAMSPSLTERRNEAGDPLSEMFDFMLRAMATRGGIAGFHALGGRAYEVPDSAFPMRPAVFHLEDGMAGYFGLALDDDDRIDHFSLILKSEICGAGSKCDRMIGLPRAVLEE